MAGFNVTTPGGKTVQLNPNVTFRMDWNPAFGPRATAALDAAQYFVDSEALRYCSALVPHRTGFLMTSGIHGSAVGSGELGYNAVYARRQYYDTADTRPYDANRGAHWFDRMKAAHKDEILEGAKKFF
jgi:hypothetical protein